MTEPMTDEDAGKINGADSSGYGPDSTAGPLPLLDTDGAADILKVSRRTIEKWVAEGRLPVVRLGDTTASGRGILVRFRPESLEAWIKSKEVQPHE